MRRSGGRGPVLTMDLHADQIQGFSTCRWINIYAAPILLGDCGSNGYEDLLVVFAPTWAAWCARARWPSAWNRISPYRQAPPEGERCRGDEHHRRRQGRTCVIMDDMVDTAGTLAKAAQALKNEGAIKVLAYCTHPVLSGGAVERIANSALDEVVVTDSIPLREDAKKCSKIRVLSVVDLLAETILRISNEDSVSSLFSE